MVRSGFRSLIFAGLVMAAAMTFATPSLRGATLTYILNGGTQTMSGTVGPLSFTDATWVVQAAADPANVVAGTIDAVEPVPAYFLPANVSLSITDAANGVTTMSMINPPGATWGVISHSFGSMIPGASVMGFAAFSTGTSRWSASNTPVFALATGGMLGGTPGGYNNLGSVGTWLGGSVSPGENSVSLSTSLGVMTKSGYSNGVNTGSFAIVPEPATSAIALAGAVCGGISIMRRRKWG